MSLYSTFCQYRITNYPTGSDTFLPFTSLPLQPTIKWPFSRWPCDKSPWGPFHKCLWAYNANLVEIHVALTWQKWSNHVPILHMARQLSCHAVCKIMTWFGHYFSSKSSMNFYKISIMSLSPLCDTCHCQHAVGFPRNINYWFSHIFICLWQSLWTAADTAGAHSTFQYPSTRHLLFISVPKTTL